MILPRRGWTVAALATGLAASGCATAPPPDDAAVPVPVASSAASKPSFTPSHSTAGKPAASGSTPTTVTFATPLKAATAQPSIHRRVDGSLTVTVSGDLLWHPSTWRTAREDGHGKNDFAPIFGTVAPILRNADVSICHEEVPVAPKGSRYSGYPEFGVPTEIAKAIATVGFDACSTASNHSFDRGFPGLKATLDALDAAHVKYSGTARTQAEAERPVIVTGSNGLKLGLVSGTYGLNGSTPPKSTSWAWSDIEADHLIKRAEAAKKAGADIVIVAAHSGLEYHHEPTQEQVRLARRLTASPAIDMVYCHHSHVVEPWTRMNGKLVMYGLGNFVAQQSSRMPGTNEGVVGRVTFRVRSGKVSTMKAEYIPIFIGSKSDGPIRVHAVDTELKSGMGNQVKLKATQRDVSRAVKLLGIGGVTEA